LNGIATLAKLVERLLIGKEVVGTSSNALYIRSTSVIKVLLDNKRANARHERQRLKSSEHTILRERLWFTLRDLAN
jgi:hypothetical protein